MTDFIKVQIEKYQMIDTDLHSEILMCQHQCHIKTVLRHYQIKGISQNSNLFGI
jgi:hypothetical protein